VIAVVGDPNVCAEHGVPLQVHPNGIWKHCPKCFHRGSCPHHPQAQVWQHPDGARCAICGYFYDGREPPASDPPEFRTFAHYRSTIAPNDQYKGTQMPLEYHAVGLAEEAAEVLGLIKKVVWHLHTLDITRVREELGDTFFYLDRVAARVGLTLEEVAADNVRKIKRLYPNGFDPEVSRNRKRLP